MHIGLAASSNASWVGGRWANKVVRQKLTTFLLLSYQSTHVADPWVFLLQCSSFHDAH